MMEYKMVTLNRSINILMISMLVVMSLLFSRFSWANTELTEEQYIERLHAALVAIKDKAESKPQQPIAFAANLFYAHEAVIEHISLPILLKYADALIEVGVQRVDINPGLYPWINGEQQSIAKYDALIQHLRAAGVQIALNPQYSPTYHQVNDLAEWRDKAIPVFAELARRYQPDIFVVVHEPTTMAARMGVQASPDAWASFAKLAALTVKRESPRTRVGAGGLYWEEAFFNAFSKLLIIDVMTIDIYNLAGLDVYNRMIVNAKRRGKPVYIEETWRPSYVPDPDGMTLEELSMQGIGKRAFMPLDILWLQTMTAYARAWGLESITPFWSPTFFAYVDEGGNALDPAYTLAVIEAILNETRTDTYQAFKALNN